MMLLHEEQSVGLVVKVSVALLLLLSLFGLLFFSTETGLGVLAGGAIGIANFLWMHRILRRILATLPNNPNRQAMVWLVLRLVVLAGILYPLVVSGSVSLAGLLTGLSIIVLSIGSLSFRAVLTARG
ncbi:ATP synthase subunit I [Pelobacter propionicus]|uniref:ATP synthase I chain n=1 Tax=Pelobacter propionicus (strain DSM 2379 / NBRC 103807 / OttBd1) TaxID=338966 RepID=A1AP55_PELPD|nr:ATP synthase subunit I [Pelobacter propionicus]ABK99125.1 conserved hypothetical protein [Pelobacter propionicus DSM 2379]